jgi:hypothetical protein
LGNVPVRPKPQHTTRFRQNAGATECGCQLLFFNDLLFGLDGISIEQKFYLEPKKQKSTNVASATECYCPHFAKPYLLVASEEEHEFQLSFLEL